MKPLNYHHQISFWEYQAFVGQSIGMNSKECWELHENYKQMFKLRQIARR